jgi:hypothetical protein
MASVKVSVASGPSAEVSWSQNMNAQQALELAWVALEKQKPHAFTYALQYFGQYGYMVSMINETYDTFASTYAPFYYWEFFVNGQPPIKGIDETILSEGDQVSFSFSLYTPQEASAQLTAKHETYMKALQGE